jgi:voltage-gated potassium channel
MNENQINLDRRSIAGESDSLIERKTSLKDAIGHKSHSMRQKATVISRSSVHRTVEGLDGNNPIETFLLVLIFANVVSLAVSTMVVDRKCQERDCLRYGDDESPSRITFELFEFFSVMIFTTEYVVRMWSCVEDPEYKMKGPIRGRLAYGMTFFMLVDLASIMPYWIILCIPDTSSPGFLTSLRVFRLVRLLKADKYINAFGLLEEVVSENSHILVAGSFYAMIVWVLGAGALFLVERESEDIATQQLFRSIPEALYPVLIMLMGNMPDADLSPMGRVVAGMISLSGTVVVFAVPSAVLASGFIRAVERPRSTGVNVGDNRRVWRQK